MTLAELKLHARIDFCNVGAWLRDQELGQYEEAFRQNDIDDEVLRDLSAEDLIGLGVASVGHRRKLLAAMPRPRDGLGTMVYSTATKTRDDATIKIFRDQRGVPQR